MHIDEELEATRQLRQDWTRQRDGREECKEEQLNLPGGAETLIRVKWQE